MSTSLTKEQLRSRPPEPTQDEKLTAARKLEDKRWAEAEAIYAWCKATMERVWAADLDAAVEAQRNLTEAMRDRGYDAEEMDGGLSIPVPLFTPRDRVQFLKEATVAFFIAADKRNLTVTPEQEVQPLDEMPAALQAPEGPYT